MVVVVAEMVAAVAAAAAAAVVAAAAAAAVVLLLPMTTAPPAMTEGGWHLPLRMASSVALTAPTSTLVRRRSMQVLGVLQLVAVALLLRLVAVATQASSHWTR